jgi:hypothetical protein
VPPAATVVTLLMSTFTGVVDVLPALLLPSWP